MGCLPPSQQQRSYTGGGNRQSDVASVADTRQKQAEERSSPPWPINEESPALHVQNASPQLHALTVEKRG